MFGENNALERFFLVNVFFRQMIISGYLIEAVFLTFLSPSREALGITQRNILTSTGGSGKEPRNMSIPRRRLSPRKAKYLYDEA